MAKGEKGKVEKNLKSKKPKDLGHILIKKTPSPNFDFCAFLTILLCPKTQC